MAQPATDHDVAVTAMHTENSRPPRKIRSFVRREGRLTTGQQHALDTFWPRYGINPGTIIDPAALYLREAPLTLEIGFGNGDNLLHMAGEAPDGNFLGIEVHRPGVGRLLHELDKRQLENVRVICADAVEVLQHALPEQSLQRVLLLFPDPWHKKRHHKRRIVQQAFIDLLASRLQPGGLLHMATDWEDYATHMLAVMQDQDNFRNCAGNGQASERPAWRCSTRFEQRGLRLGHPVYDLLFERR